MSLSREVLCVEENKYKTNSVYAEIREERYIFGGPKELSINYKHDGFAFTVKIKQCGKREIELSSAQLVEIAKMYEQFTLILKLLQILEGRFYSIKKLIFNSKNNTEERYEIIGKTYLSSQLSYYESTGFACEKSNKLIDIFSYLTQSHIEKWIQFQNEFFLPHQMFLYACGKSGFTCDMQCAFLIELCESLNLFLKVGVSNTLRRCIEKIIDIYGTEIFKYEKKYDKFFDIIVNTRINIMHAKKDYKTPFLEKEENALYAVKFYLLYRVSAISYIGFDKTMYQQQLLNCISIWESWETVYSDFMKKLHTDTKCTY